jgi:DNA polymerase
MLAEMGVRVWSPQRAAAEQPQVQALAAAPDVALPVSAPAVLPVSRPAAPASAPALALVGQPLAEGVDQMDWAALQATAANCRACDLCANRQQAVLGVGDVQADWMVIGDPPVEAEGQHGELFVGPSKQLLENMLKAVGLSREAKGEGGD